VTEVELAYVVERSRQRRASLAGADLVRRAAARDAVAEARRALLATGIDSDHLRHLEVVATTTPAELAERHRRAGWGRPRRRRIR
jgi:hypothetical protein